MINLQEFISKTIDKSINVDNVYGSQCYDLVAQWIIDNNWGNGFYCQWSGGVKDLAEHFNEISGIDRSKVEYIANNPNNIDQLPQPGDIIIFGNNWGGGYGHIGICISANTGSMKTLEQNIGNGDGSGWDDRTQIVENRFYTGLLGWVREKKQNQDIMLKNSIKEAIEQSPYTYQERTSVIQNAVDNNDGGYIVGEMNMAWGSEQRLSRLLDQNIAILKETQNELEKNKIELEKLKIEHKNCKVQIDAILETQTNNVTNNTTDIKETPNNADMIKEKFSLNKFMIGLAKTGQLQIVLGILATSLAGYAAKAGLNVTDEQVLGIMIAVFGLFGLNITVATNNNTK